MADHGEVKLRDVKIQALIDTYHKAYKDIVTTITDATDAGKINKFQVMATIKSQLKDLGDDVDKWVAKEIPQYYLDGANIAKQDLTKLGVALDGPRGLAPINKEAIAFLVDDTRNAFGASINTISRSASNLLSTAVKQQISATLAEGKLTGAARKTISDGIVKTLKDNGLSALTDSSGRSWAFDTYAEMLVRTKAVESRNAGLQDKMLQNGYDLVQVSDHNSDHPECADWEGEILSISGDTDGYATTDEAEADGLMHPNCQHAYNVIDPELAAKTEAYDNPYNDLGTTEKAAADQEFEDRDKKS